MFSASVFAVVRSSSLAYHFSERRVRRLSTFRRSQLRRTHSNVPTALIAKRRWRGEFQRVRHPLDYLPRGPTDTKKQPFLSLSYDATPFLNGTLAALGILSAGK